MVRVTVLIGGWYALIYSCSHTIKTIDCAEHENMSICQGKVTKKIDFVQLNMYVADLDGLSKSQGV